jgi:hypothetical protein
MYTNHVIYTVRKKESNFKLNFHYTDFKLNEYDEIFLSELLKFIWHDYKPDDTIEKLIVEYTTNGVLNATLQVWTFDSFKNKGLPHYQNKLGSFV